MESNETVEKTKPVKRSYKRQLGAVILFHRKPHQWPFNKIHVEWLWNVLTVACVLTT